MVCNFCPLHDELLIRGPLEREGALHPSLSHLGDEPLVQRALGLALCLTVQLDVATLQYQTLHGLLGNDHLSWSREGRMEEEELGSRHMLTYLTQGSSNAVKVRTNTCP